MMSYEPLHHEIYSYGQSQERGLLAWPSLQTIGCANAVEQQHPSSHRAKLAELNELYVMVGRRGEERKTGRTE